MRSRESRGMSHAPRFWKLNTFSGKYLSIYMNFTARSNTWMHVCHVVRLSAKFACFWFSISTIDSLPHSIRNDFWPALWPHILNSVPVHESHATLWNDIHSIWLTGVLKLYHAICQDVDMFRSSVMYTNCVERQPAQSHGQRARSQRKNGRGEG